MNANRNNSLVKLESFFDELKDTISFIKLFSVSDINQIKHLMENREKLPNYIRINEMNNLLKNFQMFINEKTTDNDLINILEEKKNTDDIKVNIENDNLNQVKNKIIYGDYTAKNESVEVYLHQRTMKKVKYKKRDYAEIHPMDLIQLESIKERLIDLYSNDLENGNLYF